MGSPYEWAHRRIVKQIAEALSDAPAWVVRGTLVAAHGAPVSRKGAAAQLLALAMVRAALPTIRSAASPLRALDRMLVQLEDVDASFGRIEPDEETVAYVLHPRRESYRVAAYLWLRAHRRGRTPTKKQVRGAVRALREAEARARGRRKPRR
jgi:hypothetical protein